MSKAPKVSVVSITYNQEKYIRETLEGFIAQQTGFDFEVIIADDCSTDKTPEIIKEYAEAYPDIFKPILRKKNVGIQENLYDAMRAAKGHYIALCEGDDYWTDPKKLQIQADFMDNNPDFALCFHKVRVFFESGDEEERLYPETKGKPDFSVGELLKVNYIQTNSVMYRRQNYQNMPANIMPLDWYLHLYHAQFGKIGFIDRVMSVYRRHEGGVWWDSHKNIDELWKKHGVAHMALYTKLLELFGNNASYKTIIYDHISDMFNTLAEVDKKHGGTLIHKALKEFPGIVEPVLVNQSRTLNDLQAAVSKAEKALADLEQSSVQKDQQIQQKTNQIKLMKSSKFWRARNIAAKIVGRQVI